MKTLLACNSLLAAAAVLTLMSLVSMPSPAAAQSGNPSLTAPITGAVDGGGRLVGTLAIQRFAVQGNQIVAVGTLTGTVTNAAGAVVANVVRTVALPINAPAANAAAAQASCEVLHLELGPLDLELLGLVVHLDRVVLDIGAEPGAGNLLGNLLCSVAGLLNGNGPLDAIVGLLNRILAQL